MRIKKNHIIASLALCLFIVNSPSTLELALVISLESVKKTVQFAAKEDVGDLEVKMMCLEWGW